MEEQNSKANTYKLKQGEKEYIFTTNIVENKIHLSCESIDDPSKKKYQRDLSLEDLHSIDKSFSEIQSLSEGINFIDNLLKEQKVAVTEEDKNIKIVFYISTKNIVNPVDFEIIENTNEYTDYQNYENIETTTYEAPPEINMETLPTKILPIIFDTNNTYAPPISYQPPEYTLPPENTYVETPVIEQQQIETTTNIVEETPAYTENVQIPEEEMPVSLKVQYENEIKNLKAEIEAYKQKIVELSKYQTQGEEAKILKQQLELLLPLKEQCQEIPKLRAQLIELNELKIQMAEFETLKSKLNACSKARMELTEMLKQREEEILILKKKLEEYEKLKREYEKEIDYLKGILNSSIQGLESKNLVFEPEKLRVKGDIIQNAEELEMITRKINKDNQKITLNLLYKATCDSDKASAFHNKCDDALSSLVLIETNKGKRFGGFTTATWKGDNIEKKDDDAFIFSLDKMKTYDVEREENAIGCYPKFGPIFLGCQIRINDEAFTKGGTTFEKGVNYETQEDFELTGGDRTFIVKEIEVYEVIAQ